MWLRDRPKWDQPHYNKLKRIWQGPYEVIRWEGGDRCVIQVRETQKVVASDRLKLYRSMFGKVKAPSSYYSDTQLLPKDDTHIVDDVLDYAVKRLEVPRLTFRCMWLERMMSTRRGRTLESSFRGEMIGLNIIARAMV